MPYNTHGLRGWEGFMSDYELISVVFMALLFAVALAGLLNDRDG